MGQLGGMGTAGMVPAWCPFSDGEKIIYRGLAEKIFEASKKGVPHERKQKLKVRQLEKDGKICYDEMEQRTLSESGLARWGIIKKKKNHFTILPLNSYKVKKLDIDEIYLP